MRIASRIVDLGIDRSKKVGLVPTMGALHEGHVSLMERARQECDVVVVSVFVNPTQFGPTEDYRRYPRDLEADSARAAAAGVDIVFAPEVEEMYRGAGTRIVVPSVTELYEGAIRPGHFEGVATVVAKLFNIVRPNFAYFGLKDLQQCAVIQRMVRDLNFDLEPRLCEIYREPSGLAMSSRNAYLTDEQRASASAISRTLRHIADELRNEASGRVAKFHDIVSSGRSSLTEAGLDVDYLDIVDYETMHPASNDGEHLALIAAVRCGNTRLIDNVIL